MRIFCFYPVKIHSKNPKPHGPYVIVANHSSYLDIFLMYSILPKYPFVFLGKSELLKYPILRTYFKNLNIPVYRNDKSKAGQAYLAATKAFKDGYSIVIFPEGGIADEHLPKMLPFKNGAFKLAQTLNSPILPITFVNNHKLFSDPTHLLGPARPGLSIVHIHELIELETVQKLTMENLKSECFDVISEPLKKEYPHLYL